MFWLVLPLLVLPGHTGRAAEPTSADGLQVSVTPAVTYVSVSGNEARFREDWWQTDEWSGGAQEFTLHQAWGEDGTLDVSGRGVFDSEDYQVKLDLVKEDKGFIRAGFEQFRRYYDATGGFYESFSAPGFDLGGDPHLDIGRIYVELGLTLPDAPKIVLGYERRYKHGEKSLLEWGTVTEGVTQRNIFPSLKYIDETTDIVKLEVEHDIGKVRVADQFRWEHYRSDTDRYDTAVSLDTLTAKTVVVHEDYTHDAFFNTFRMDSHLNEKFYWSLGYLYNLVDGDAGLAVVTPPPLLPFDRNWVTQAVDLELDSHVVNLNALVGPFAGLSLYGGLQAEKTDTDGSTSALLTSGLNPATANVIHSDSDKLALQENFGLRYTKIPFTTLYAEGKWTEGDTDLSERETEDAVLDFRRQTDATIFRQDYTAGVNSSPWRRVTLAGRYRHSIHENDYDHDVDTMAGYPAYITEQEFTTDELMAKVTVRPCAKFTLSFSYQLVATDIETTTAVVPLLAPGGTLQAGNFDSMIYTVSATLTPVTRLFLTGLFSYQDTRTQAFANDNSAVVTYEGDVFTFLGTAGYALDEKSDLTLEYLYSRADNEQNNVATGLPLGIQNQRHGLLVGLSRAIRENVSARLRYGFYELNEDGTGDFNNYTAHLVSASCTIRF